MRWLLFVNLILSSLVTLESSEALAQIIAPPKINVLAKPANPKKAQTAANTGLKARAPSLVSYFSQKVNEIHEGERCRKATYEENLVLSESTQVCTANTPQRNQRASYEDISEALFFETAAKEQLKIQECLSGKANALKSPAKSLKQSRAREAIAANFAVKIPKLRSLNKDLESVEDELASIEREASRSAMGETLTTRAPDEKKQRQLKAQREKLVKAIEAIQTSLWEGNNHHVQEFVKKQVELKDFDSQRFTQNFLNERKNDQSFDELLSKISTELGKETEKLSAKAKTKKPTLSDFELTDKDKIQLYKEQNWLNKLYEQTGENTMAFTALTCRLEGRYGKGRERFYQDAGWAASGALALLPGGFTLAAGRGLITQSSARMLGIAAGTSLASGTISMTYEQKCHQASAGLSIKASCEANSDNVIKALAYEDCALDVALAALDLPFPELKSVSMASLAFGLTRQESKLVRNPQMEIWRARELGKVAEAQRLEESFLKLMNEGKMEVLGMVGEGKSGAFFVQFEDGLQGVWKPSQAKFANAKHELAVKAIDDILGTDNVALTVPRKLFGIEGTVQLKVTDLAGVGDQWFPDRLVYFDYLIGNADRHPDNYLVTRDGRLVAIDHGLAFHGAPEIPKMKALDDSLSEVAAISKKRNETYAELKQAMEKDVSLTDTRVRELRNALRQQQIAEANARTKALKLAEAMTPAKETVQRLKILNRSDWQKILGDSLSTKQLDELYERQQTILKSISRSEALLGKDIYPARSNTNRQSPAPAFH